MSEAPEAPQRAEDLDKAPDPAAAFEALQGEVAQVREVLEALGPKLQGLESVDYTDTLGALDRSVRSLTVAMDRIEAHPALKLTPADYARQLTAVGDRLNRELRDELISARTAFYGVTRDLQDAISRARERDRQDRWLVGALGCGAVLGMVLWVMLSGPIARGLLRAWDAPERMAAATLHEDRWTAGEQLMQSGDPAGWKTFVASIELVKANQDAIDRCRQDPRHKGQVRCTIMVQPEGERPRRTPGT